MPIYGVKYQLSKGSKGSAKEILRVPLGLCITYNPRFRMCLHFGDWNLEQLAYESVTTTKMLGGQVLGDSSQLVFGLPVALVLPLLMAAVLVLVVVPYTVGYKASQGTKNDTCFEISEAPPVSNRHLSRKVPDCGAPVAHSLWFMRS